MNLLIINDGGLAGGGAELRALSLLDYWYKKKVISVVHLLHRKEVKKRVDRPYIKSAPISDSKERNNFIKLLTGSEPIDLVQVHNVITSGAQIFPVIKETKKPLVWMVHDHWPICGTNYLCTSKDVRCDGPGLFKCTQCIGLKSTLRVKNFHRYFPYVDVALAPSTSIRDKLRGGGINVKSWKVLDPWIDLEIFKSESEKVFHHNDPKVFYVGPLSYAKGADLALEAFKVVLEKFPKAKLYMVGGEDYHGKWAHDLAKKLGISESVEWVSRIPQPELANKLRAADLLLFPSRCIESFGQVWAQAMALGCPVVAIDAPSVRSIVKGNLVDFSDLSGKKLGIKASELLSDEKRKSRISKDSIQFARQCFNIEGAAEKVAKLYKDLILKSLD